MGATAGARSVRQAIEAILHNIPLEEAAREHAELAAALKDWGLCKGS
jgi:ribulose 1,5-bisphosphate carboxylase large subunit-like protein